MLVPTKSCWKFSLGNLELTHLPDLAMEQPDNSRSGILTVVTERASNWYLHRTIKLIVVVLLIMTIFEMVYGSLAMPLLAGINLG